MKMRTDVIKMYKEIHGWVGIISGLALFIAFYAGAITMFENQVQRWASPPSMMAPAPSLDDTPALIAKVVEAYPEAAAEHDVNLVIDAANPARVSWISGKDGTRGSGTKHFATLAPDGSLQVETQGPSQVAEFIDVLHQQVGLPFEHEVAMPIMGAIALLYFVAIVSGLIVLLPSLVSDLFAVRLGRNVKRMWLDMHNLLGVFSLPFHIIMALTAVVFAFHDQFYDAQGAAFGPRERPARSAPVLSSPETLSAVLTPSQVVTKLEEQAPGFTPFTLEYHREPDEAHVRITGGDARHGLRGATFGIVELDAVTGEVSAQDYMPALQDGWSATITSFFALHFGNFGGAPIRWSYFLLGLAGAFLFYTGNILWVESRRKRERKAGAVEQTRSTRVLGALTVGVPIGCIAGISATLAAAKFLGNDASDAMHSAIYYTVFLICVGWGLCRGAARSAMELPVAAAVAMILIPIASLYAGTAWYDSAGIVLVDVTAIVMSGILLAVSRAAYRRSGAGPTDSVWSKKVNIPLTEPGS